MMATKPKMGDPIQTSRQKTPPPLVNPGIFQPKMEGTLKSKGGWGSDWTEDVTPKQQSQVSVMRQSHDCHMWLLPDGA